MKLPHITPKQQAVLSLLYTHRFLDRIQIQAFMQHKDYKTINMWLKDLLAKGYVGRIYTDDFVGRTKPAIYYLALNGVRHLRTLDHYPDEEIRKRYRDPSRSQTFIDHSLLIASCCLDIERGRTKTRGYQHVVEAEYRLADCHYRYILDQDLIRPDLCFRHFDYDENKQPIGRPERYLLEIIDISLPHYRVRKKLSNYLKYVADWVWDDEPDVTTPPTILLVYPRLADLISAKRRVRKYIGNIYDDEHPKVLFMFTTTNSLKEHGVLGQNWEKA